MLHNSTLDMVSAVSFENEENAKRPSGHSQRTQSRVTPGGPCTLDLPRTSPASSDGKAKHWESSLLLQVKKQQRHHHYRFHPLSQAEARTATMGLMDYMEDLYASLTWREVQAEAPESGMYIKDAVMRNAIGRDMRS